MKIIIIEKNHKKYLYHNTTKKIISKGYELIFNNYGLLKNQSNYCKAKKTINNKTFFYILNNEGKEIFKTTFSIYDDGLIKGQSNYCIIEDTLHNKSSIIDNTGKTILKNFYKIFRNGLILNESNFVFLYKNTKYVNIYDVKNNRYVFNKNIRANSIFTKNLKNVILNSTSEQVFDIERYIVALLLNFKYTYNVRKDFIKHIFLEKNSYLIDYFKYCLNNNINLFKIKDFEILNECLLSNFRGNKVNKLYQNRVI